MKRLLLTTALLLAPITAQAASPWETVHSWINSKYELIFDGTHEGEELEALTCLSLNVYHEARGSTMDDMAATAHVVLNRVEDERWPDTICGVVWQARKSKWTGKLVPQFSWTIDGKSDRPRNKDAWEQSQAVAFAVYTGIIEDSTDGADHYHTTEVNPKWSPAGYDRIIIGAHEYMKVGTSRRIVLASN